MSQYGEGEYPSVSRHGMRTARKPHICCACKETIQPGHRYMDIWFVFEGEPQGYKRCERCETIYQHLSDRIDASTDDPFDDFEHCDDELACGHTYEERWKEAPPAWLAALAFWRPGDPLPDLSKEPA